MGGPSPLVMGMMVAAEAGAKILLRHFKALEKLTVDTKGYGDFVSEADRKSERAIQRVLKKIRPEAAFMLEEGGTIGDPGAGLCWIVDPLDGTANFLSGIPHWCISIGLTDRNQPVAGVIYDPLRNEMFWAERGRGAWVNRRRLQVSSRPKIELAMTGIGGADRSKALVPTWQAQNLAARQLHGLILRRLGSGALDLAYLAAGRFSIFWENALSPWDVAAGWLMVTEAGGVMTNHRGAPYALGMRDILAAPETLHRGARKVLQKALKSVSSPAI